MPHHAHAGFKLIAVLRVDLGTLPQRPFQTFLRLHCVELVGVLSAPCITAQQHGRPIGEIAGRRVADLTDGEIGVADTAIDIFILFPEAAFELEAPFRRSIVVHRTDRIGQITREVVVDLSEDRKRNGTDTIVRFAGLLTSTGRVFPCHRYPTLVLLQRDDFGVIGNKISNLALEPFGDTIHPANRLKHRSLVIHCLMRGEILPKPRLQHLLRVKQVRSFRRCPDTAARLLCVAAIMAGVQALQVFVLFVQHAEGPQAFQ